MLRVTVSGLPGSGTSTLVALLASCLGLTSLNGGDVFRAEAARRGVSVQEFSAICEREPEVDIELDALLRERMADSEGPGIIESRLAGWWAFESRTRGRTAMPIDKAAKIWIAVEEEERMRRIVEREGGTMQERTRENRARAEQDRQRYRDLYGIDIDDMTPYDAVIDGTRLSAEQVRDLVLERIEEVDKP